MLAIAGQTAKPNGLIFFEETQWVTYVILFLSRITFLTSNAGQFNINNKRNKI